MIDEPELNLHPENQRRVARLFVRLVNIGIKVFITTHSDYIIKELNTLIMLNQGGKRLKVLAEREHYRDSEMLNPDKVRVYIAEEVLIKMDGAKKKTKCQTLTQADIDSKFGIEARSFDKTIEDMNRIQEEIVWGGDE
jgi:ABC-type multidrug transport system ATPase subunit